MPGNSKLDRLAYCAKERAGAAAMDAAAVAIAYFTALSLRLTFNEPIFGWKAAACSCAVVCAVHMAAFALCGAWRVPWRHIRMNDAPRFFAATALAAATLLVMRALLPDSAHAHLRPPYSVAVMTFFFATSAVLACRLMWRLYNEAKHAGDSMLAREELRFDNTAAARFLVGKCVMVTGAGGSIGSEIVRQVAAAGAAKVLLVERGENALYEIDRELAATRMGGRAVALMRDAGDRERMAAVFAEHRPDVLLHAAAYKHVPMVEINPEEGWRNNVEVTKTLAALAIEYGVKRFVLISTDKAVNPVSVMGKTKRAAEQAIMEAGARQDAAGTSFCAVRFGNVYGSSGSVVPLFREQIAHRGPVTVTHPEMRRYFMTVQEAVSLVLQAASRPEKAIYTLDMGESVRIVTLAERMIEAAGYRPYVDIPIVFTGVRPGEKLFEELDVSGRTCYRTDMAKIYITKQENG